MEEYLNHGCKVLSPHLCTCNSTLFYYAVCSTVCLVKVINLYDTMHLRGVRVYPQEAGEA